MKIEQRLLKRHIQPYLRNDGGSNYFQHFTSSGENADISVGLIRAFDPEVHDDIEEHNGVIVRLAIHTDWLVRIRQAIKVMSINDESRIDIIDGSFQRGYIMDFDSPILVNERSPLCFKSRDEIIEITHITSLGKMLIEVSEILAGKGLLS